MGVTYTRAAERSAPTANSRWTRAYLALLTTSLVSVAAMGLTFVGRWHAVRTAEAPATAPVVNLSQHPSAESIEPALVPLFDTVADRRFAARELARAVAVGGELSNITHVGALSTLAVSEEAISRTRGLRVYADRLQTGGRVPLLTASDISRLKPSFIVRTEGSHRTAVLWSVAAIVLAFHLVAGVWRAAGRRGDLVLLGAVHLLVTLGAMVMIGRPDPLRDSLLISRFSMGVLLGAALCALVSLVRLRSSGVLQLPYLALIGALSIGLALALFGTGPGSSGAKVNLGAFQPAEIIRLLLAFFLAGYLGRRWELLRQVRETAWRGRPLPGWLNLPRWRHVGPMMAGVGLSLILFFSLRDLGPALLVSMTFLVLFAFARAGAGAILAGAAMLGAGFLVGYWLDISSTLTSRVGMWLSPWANQVRGGDQVAHAYWALGAGAVTGAGSGLGDTRYLPAGHTDLVIAAIGEDLGFVGLLIAAAAGTLIFVRGLRTARRASSDRATFLALALTLSIVVPMLVMAAGILGLMPLTGVVTPFVSYGGSAMLVNFTTIGLLASLAGEAAPAADTRPFAAPARWTCRAAAAALVVVLAVAARAQVVSADAVLVRAQLGVQADGGLRYQYNPRVIDAADTLPRGSIFDRHGAPIAGSSDIVSKTAGTARSACTTGTTRCYPLGGAAFHVLGDAESRANWPASNSSYVERDAEASLRGFDDHAVVSKVTVGGKTVTALRKDYRDLVPLVRHRWTPDHEAVRALRERPRDVRLTIDARLQREVAAIVKRAVSEAGTRHGAAVVVDAASGEVLASVSYPWPATGAAAEVDREVWLDRARYGLYPPGSTFKLLTAAAALRLDPELARQAFSCTRLPGDRVGARIPGFGRPVRDDVRDTEPHGTLTLHDAIVRSCNAYFAQMAVRLGADELAATADLAGLVFPSPADAARRREQLPHAGYGQGDVLATPLRMARVAAAIASDGMLREPPIVRDRSAFTPGALVPPASARLLAGYMRDAVTHGTGRSLATHAGRIAGKTGTAEVDDAPSHAWFVGFAPAGSTQPRLAFAVLLEHAGYGGRSAAAAAGQIVTAAGALGLTP